MAIKIEPQKVFTVSLICLVVIVGLSWLVNQFSPGTLPQLKVGFLLILFGIVVLLTTLFTLGLNINQIKTRDIIFMILILGILVAAYLIIPSIIPDAFSIYQFRDFFTKTLGSIGSMGTGIV